MLYSITLPKRLKIVFSNLKTPFYLVSLGPLNFFISKRYIVVCLQNLIFCLGSSSSFVGLYNSKLVARDDEGVIATLTAGLLLAECAESRTIAAYYIDGEIWPEFCAISDICWEESLFYRNSNCN